MATESLWTLFSLALWLATGVVLLVSAFLMHRAVSGVLPGLFKLFVNFVSLGVFFVGLFFLGLLSSGFFRLTMIELLPGLYVGVVLLGFALAAGFASFLMAAVVLKKLVRTTELSSGGKEQARTLVLGREVSRRRRKR